MSDKSPLLSLPYIQAAQAQKHVTHNEAIELLDALTQIALEALDATTPPGNAAEGQAWAVGAGPSGAWAGRGGDIAAWRGGGWLFITPQVGWVAWDKTTAALYVLTNAGWTAQQGAAPDFDNLDGVGINATSDGTNKLAVAADATLLTHDGSGHQLKINKAGPTDTASLLYQTNWSGRAEMGLAGNDDFSVKVSADGASFTESLRIDASTGAVTMPTTGSRQLMPLNYRYYIYSDLRWVGVLSNPGSFNASQSLGTGAEPNLDWDAKGVFLPAGTVISSLKLSGNFNASDVADIDLRVLFQHGPSGGGWVSNASTTHDILVTADAAGFTLNPGMNNATYPLAYTTPEDGYFSVAMRPHASSTLSTTRYFFMAGLVDVTVPPSV